MHCHPTQALLSSCPPLAGPCLLALAMEEFATVVVVVVVVVVVELCAPHVMTQVRYTCRSFRIRIRSFRIRICKLALSHLQRLA
jgi:hypothetical protein